MNLILTTLIVLVLAMSTNTMQSQSKPRVLILTDIENEPDDAQSMVRLMLYSNLLDIEGLVATTSRHLPDKTAEWRIEEIVTAYGQVRENLLKHESGYPTEDHLKSLIKVGIPKYGMEGVGEGMDTQGSNWLIEVADREDPRPLWVSVWGGANVLAQALWKVRRTRTTEELQQFVSRLRVYTISDQDNSAEWIRREFPQLFYIVSAGENYRNATWAGISGEPWYKFASGADTTLVKNPWLRTNIIEDHGPLGAQYPEVEYAMEGDTPSFLGLIPNGLNVPERPDYGGWGGRYELYTPRFLEYRHLQQHQPETRPIWTDATDEVVGKDGRVYIDNHATIWRWRDHFQHDFAARMDWCTMSPEAANHPPVANVNGDSVINIRIGEWVTLDAGNSSDPDGDELQYQWIHYPETGTFYSMPWRSWQIEGADTSTVRFRIHPNAKLTSAQHTQFILAVTDNGDPALTRYQRVKVNIFP